MKTLRVTREYQIQTNSIINTYTDETVYHKNNGQWIMVTTNNNSIQIQYINNPAPFIKRFIEEVQLKPHVITIDYDYMGDMNTDNTIDAYYGHRIVIG